MLDQLNERIAFYDEMMEHIARTRYPKYCLLNQVGGVGVHTALLYMLTIGDPERFQKSRWVGCFLGMRPKKQDSGENKPQLGITKAGDVYLRKTLVNCAQHISDPADRTVICDVLGYGSVNGEGKTPKSVRWSLWRANSRCCYIGCG